MVEIKNEFLTIAPRDNTFNKFNIQPVKLKVIQTKGVEVTPQVNIKVNEFNQGYNQFVNNSGNADRFKIDIIIHKDETITGHQHISIHQKEIRMSLKDISGNIPKDMIPFIELPILQEGIDIEEDKYDEFPLTYVLDYWIRTATPLMVVTRAIDIPNGEYIIVENGSRKQTYNDHTIWSLEFVKYNLNIIGQFKNNNAIVQKAISNFENKKKSKNTSKAKSTTNQTNTLKKKLKKCDYKKLVYSKKKKVTDCNKTLQQLLNKYVGSKLIIDGWFGSETVKAVKKFQKKYKTKYKLKETGKIDSATFKALYTGGSSYVITKTTLPSKLPTGIIKTPE